MMSKKLYIFFLLMVLIQGCTNSPASHPPAVPLDSIAVRFGNELQKDIGNDVRGASVSIAITHENKIVWSKAFGYSDKGSGTLADTSTIYRIGSISKSFTSFLMMQLMEKGVLKLDDPVERYLPEVRQLKGYNDSTRITFLQLASHTSGLIREPGLFGADQGPISDWENKVLEAIPTTAFESKPGSKFGYSNIGYAILGLALSRAAGKPFTSLVEEYIFHPLQMNNSYYVVPPEKMPKLAVGLCNQALGRVDLELPKKEIAGRGYKVPNGGVFSTPNDLAKFIMANLGYYPLLEAKDREQMQTGKVKMSDWSEYGLGFFLFKDDNMRIVSHDGSVAGYSAHLSFDKKSKYGAVLLCNYNTTLNVRLDARAEQLLRSLAASGN